MMKLYIILSILIVQGELLSAQTFKITNLTPSVTKEFTEFDLVDVKAGITNTTSKDITIAYNLTSKNIPDGWQFALCDPMKCNNVGISSESGEATLNGDGKSYYFDAKIMASEPGYAELEYVVYYQAKPDNKVNVKFTFQSIPTAISKGTPVFSMVQTYPNPVIDNLNLSFTSKELVNVVELQDINGRLIYSTNCMSKSFSTAIPMNQLESGCYALIFKNQQGNIINYKKIIKN